MKIRWVEAVTVVGNTMYVTVGAEKGRQVLEFALPAGAEFMERAQGALEKISDWRTRIGKPLK